MTPLTMNNSTGREESQWLAHTSNVLEGLNEGVLIADDHHKILFANSRLTEMMSISRQELIGSDSSRFYTTHESDFITQQIETTFREGHNRFDFYLPQKDGGRLPVIISSRTIEIADSHFEIVTLTDISDRCRIEEELRAANAQLQKRQLEIEEDLRLAERVQKSLEPKSVIWNSLRVDSFYQPVHSIGGDFALVASPDREHLSLLVCDVSGHGIGSALLANRIYSETTTQLRSGIPFRDMFRDLNRFLIEDISGSGMYITMAAARINPWRRTLNFAGAGHPPALLARPGQEPALLESGAMILGVLPDAENGETSQEVQLQEDDRIVLYTDGMTEVFDSSGRMLGIDGLREIVRQSSSLPIDDMKKAILDGVASWRNGPATDDVSLMLVHVC